MKHVVVCGAGIVGLFCALHLRERGCDVSILDRDGQLGDGCSYGNAGLIAPSHFIPLAAPGVFSPGTFRRIFDCRSALYVRPRLDVGLITWLFRFLRSATIRHVLRSAPLLHELHRASRDMYESLAAVSAESIGLERSGLLMLCRSRRALRQEARVADCAAVLDLPAEVISAARAAELDPGIRMSIAGAVHYPLDCHVDPRRLMEKLLELVIASGARLHPRTEITGWSTTRRGTIAAVVSRSGELEADEFVLAAGTWSPEMVRDLGLRLPIEATKGYCLTLPNPRQLPRLCSMLTEARVAVTPLGSSLRIGGTVELGGLNRSIRRERINAIVDAAMRYFPDFRPEDFAQVRPWVGLRPCSPDGLPYIGRFARYRNLCAATGHGMMGVSLAPVTGQLVADILCGSRPRIPLAALSPDRF